MISISNVLVILSFYLQFFSHVDIRLENDRKGMNIQPNLPGEDKPLEEFTAETDNSDK